MFLKKRSSYPDFRYSGSGLTFFGVSTCGFPQDSADAPRQTACSGDRPSSQPSRRCYTERMFLKCSTRQKDGKEPRSWSVVESHRVGRGVGPRHVLYLGETNDSQRAAWQKAIDVFDEHDGQTRQCALFPAARTPPTTNPPTVQVQLNQLQLSRPRAWGACWLADQLWRDLQLDAFFAARLGCSREGTDWAKVLRRLTLYRLLSPGSEWRLHRHGFATTACADLLAVDEHIAQDDTR